MGGQSGLGLTPEDFIGKTDRDLVDAEQFEMIRALKQGVMDSDEARHVEVPLHDAQGRESIYDGAYIPRRDADGAITGIFSYFRNITAQRRTDDALQGALQELQDLYDHAPCAYHWLDANGLIVRINDTELAWLGHSREELVGKKHLADLLTPPSLPVFERNFPAFKKLGFVRDLELTLIRKDGSTFPVLVNATAVNDENGRFLRSLSTMFDVTERQRAEAVLSRYQILSSQARDIMLFVRMEDETIVEANEAAATAYCYSREELVQLGIYTLRVDPENLGIRKQMKLAGDQGLLFEAEHHRKDGSVFPVEVSSRGANLIDGEEMLVGLIRDITARKREEAELIASSARVARTLKGVVSALGASTEMRDPYTAGHQRRVADIDFGSPVATIIAQHHERLDGSGYPAGLTADQILPEARVLAVADVAEAMLSHRPYRPAWPLAAVVTEIEDGAGSLYDAAVCTSVARLFIESGFTFGE